MATLPDPTLMKISSYLSLLGSVLMFSSGVAFAQAYAFQMDEQIAIADLSDTKAVPRILTKGGDPAISPDGKQVAFTQFDEEGDRRIAIFDIATGKASLVDGIPGKSEFMPVWSVDGKQIYFSHFMETDWALARVNASGGGFQVVVEKAQRQVAGFAPMPDGQGWLCQDMDTFFTLKFDEKGKAILTDIPKDPKTLGLSMPSRISVSPDGKRALFQMTVEEDMEKGEDFPPSAVFFIEIATGKITRATPKGLFADFPAWLPNNTEFLSAVFDEKTSKSTIHRFQADGASAPMLLQGDGSGPTVASGR